MQYLLIRAIVAYKTEQVATQKGNCQRFWGGCAGGIPWKTINGININSKILMSRSLLYSLHLTFRTEKTLSPKTIY